MLSFPRHLNFLLRDLISSAIGFGSSFFIYNSLIKQCYQCLQYRSQLYLMEENKSYELLKDCFQQSFFSTQVSSSSPLPKQSSSRQPNMFRISSRFTDEPKVYLKKILSQRDKAKAQCQKAQKNHVKMKCSLQKIQRNAAICSYEFIKLYHNKKFKLNQNAILSEYKLDHQYCFRQSVDKFRKQKLYKQISLSMRKQKNERYQYELHETIKLQQKQFRETLRDKDEKNKKNVFQNYQKIQQQKVELRKTKTKLKELAATKSKFNYMTKINDQMKAIIDYTQQLQQKSKLFNPQDTIEPIFPSIFQHPSHFY